MKKKIVRHCSLPFNVLTLTACSIKNFYIYSNEVGGALRGTRQGPVLEYLWVFQHF
jgi:hypothetical protein